MWRHKKLVLLWEGSQNFIHAHLDHKSALKLSKNLSVKYMHGFGCLSIVAHFNFASQQIERTMTRESLQERDCSNLPFSLQFFGCCIGSGWITDTRNRSSVLIAVCNFLVRVCPCMSSLSKVRLGFLHHELVCFFQVPNMLVIKNNP